MSADDVVCSCHTLGGRYLEQWPVEPNTYVSYRSVYYGASPADIRGPRRDKYFVEVRRKIAGELRAAPWNLSLPHIGRLLGGRDHTTILSLLRGGKHRGA